MSAPGLIRDPVEAGQFSGHIDDNRIVCEPRPTFVRGAGVDRPQVVGDRPGQAQCRHELIGLEHRSPAFLSPLCLQSTDASKILFLSDQSR